MEDFGTLVENTEEMEAALREQDKRTSHREGKRETGLLGQERERMGIGALMASAGKAAWGEMNGAS